MAEKMENIEFQFNIIPGRPSNQRMELMDKPMAYEKDEIKLRERFFYKQAYHYKSEALQSQNISDVLWIESTLDNILKEAAKET